MATFNRVDYLGTAAQVAADGSVTGLTNPTSSISALGQSYPTAGLNATPIMAGYVPKVYSQTILRKLYETCVLADISNTDYQKDITSMGDTVIIRTTPDIQVKKYVKGQDLSYDVYDTDTVSLTIDRGIFWGFVVNPVDMKQTDLKSFVNNWTTEAAHRVKVAIEREVFAEIFDEAGEGNYGATAGKISQSYNLGTDAAPVEISKENIIDTISACGAVMGEQDMPVIAESDQFWMVVPQWFMNELNASDLRFADRTGLGKSIVLDGGAHEVPKIDVFKIYRSNLIHVGVDAASGTDPDGAASNAGVNYIMFGHKMALTFAMQLTENDIVKSETKFGDFHRGLCIYGFKVIQPKALGCLRCVKATA